MGCDISVGQGTESIKPDIVKSRSQPLFFDSPFNMNLMGNQSLGNLCENA